MDDVALFAVGIFFGWQWASWWRDKPSPVTWEHEVGAGLAATLAAMVEKRRFIGPGLVIERRWTTQTKYGEIEVCLTQRDGELIDL